VKGLCAAVVDLSKRNSPVKRLLFILIAILLATTYSHADEKRYLVPIDDSPVLGPADAAVTIIEFLDFQ
jgi:protein-disulfide isomerase